MVNESNQGLQVYCGACDIKEKLLRCAGCRVIQYYSQEHQKADWPTYKFACAKIRKCRSAVDREEEALHATPSDGFWNNGDPFINGVGHFWGILETRDYMRARYALVEANLKIKTFDALQTALDHLMDILRLWRSDNMGVRDLVPHLQLRLGRDQECYDFVKWWVTADPDGRYTMSLPYLNVKDADVLEPVEVVRGKYPELSQVVAVTLIKLRLLLAVKKGLQSSAVLRQSKSLPPEMFDHIRDQLLKSALGGRWDSMDTVQRSQLVDTLSSQIDKLYRAIDQENKHFWPALAKLGKHLTAPPTPYSSCSVAEMQLELQFAYDAWKETPGAIDFI